MYYRVAIQQNNSTTWQWKSTTISSLTALFQFLRRYDKISQDHLRVFSSHTAEEMDNQLASENNGLGSCSLTAAQFRQERMMGAQMAPVVTAVPSSHESPFASRVTSPTVSRGDFWNLMTLAK